MKNMESKRTLTRITYATATIILGFLLVYSITLAKSIGAIKIVNPSHGPAIINGETDSYYYFRAKIIADQKYDLVFKEKDCVLKDQKGREYSKCWINVVGWSSGLSVGQRAPIMMKTLSVELTNGKGVGTHKWNTSMVDGPNGALQFNIPKGGFVEVYFLWKVEEGFSASGVKIGNNFEIIF